MWYIFDKYDKFVGSAVHSEDAAALLSLYTGGWVGIVKRAGGKVFAQVLMNTGESEFSDNYDLIGEKIRTFAEHVELDDTLVISPDSVLKAFTVVSNVEYHQRTVDIPLWRDRAKRAKKLLQKFVQTSEYELHKNNSKLHIIDEAKELLKVL